MNANREQALVLFRAGNRDRTSFLLLRESGRAPHETMGFLAQQACEKFIKAVLVVHDVQFERTHDLEWLWDHAALNGVAVPVDKAALRSLNPYAVALRYEGSDVIWVSSDKAAEMVDALYQWARTGVGIEE